MSVKLLIGADVAPTESNCEAFASGDVKRLLGEKLLASFLAADARVFDLEAPLYDGSTPIQKCGPCLAAPEKSIAGVAALSPTLVTLANNHILDHGAAGFHKTVSLLKEHDIPFVGAGANAAEADKPLVLEIKGLRVGFLAFAEREFSLAGEDSPGANPFDPLEAPDAVRSLKENCDYVIVLYHGGPEGWPYPTAGLTKRLRKLADCGADAILCQHGHCVGCAETYHGAVIVYGQGNFLFDAPDGEACWDEGLVVELTLDNGRISADYLPITRVPGGVRMADGVRAEAILSGFQKRSNEIAVPGLVEEKTRERAEMLSKIFGRTLIGDNAIFRAINAFTGHDPLRNLYNETARLRLSDYLGCETLYELILAALEGER